GIVSRRYNDSVWSIEKSSCKLIFTRNEAPASVRGINSIIFRSTSERNNCHARFTWAFLDLGDSCERAINCCIALQPSPLRLSTFSSIACDTANRDVNRSGGAAINRAKVFLSQLTKFFSGG